MSPVVKRLLNLMLNDYVRLLNDYPRLLNDF